MASAFLVKDFAQTNVFVWLCTNHERVCLDMHRFCSFDNWMCDLISANWKLMLVRNTVLQCSVGQLIFKDIHKNLRIIKSLNIIFCR